MHIPVFNNKRSDFMKSAFRFIFFFLLWNFIISKVEGQNTYDPYGTSGTGNGCTVNNQQSTLISYSGYDGEYQIFLQQSYWATHGFPNKTARNAIAYKIELVSFPFATNCYACQISPTNQRVLRMPSNDFPYNNAEKAWIRPDAIYGTPSLGSTYEYKLRREFEGIYDQSTTSDYGMTDPANLASVTFKNAANVTEEHAPRVFYPHSVLKHTFYMHCDGSATSAIVDSFSFVLDHTRGKSRYYPFVGTNYVGSSASEHDIAIVPIIILPSSYYDPIDGNILNTINYFPLINPPSNCANQIPYDINLAATPDNYIRPAPYSLVNTFLGNATTTDYLGFNANTAQPGIKQDYIIDQPIDLTLINPSEKIIYNPSEVDIDIPSSFANRTLTFPSGYVFKTVSGVYPSASQVYAADPNGLYQYPEEIPTPSTLSCDDVGNTSDSYFSYYYVKSGSNLFIEPCVGLYDTKIIVEAGATVTLDPLQIYGEHYFIDNYHGSGGVINTVNLPLTTDCAHDCYDISKYDQTDITISPMSAYETWNGTSPYDLNGDGILRIANTLKIAGGKTLTINGTQRIEFGEKGKIVIEQGGQLIVNGSSGNPTVITSADICKQSMWEGIEVLGDKTKRQTIGSTQGYVKLTNVVLSNARNGIITHKGDAGDAAAIALTSGGIIHCQNVQFTNNYKDVEILTYHNMLPSALPPYTREVFNLSFFKNCIFETTNYLNDIHYKTSNGRRFATPFHVKMGDVKDVKFYACEFRNKATKADLVTPLFDTDLRGTGIKAEDATFGLYSGSPYVNTFKSLSEGVWCISADATDYFTCTGNYFKNNVHGLTLEGTNNSAINLNHFEIPASESNSGTDAPLKRTYDKPVGLYLIGAKNFTAEENTFTSYGTLNTSAPLERFNYGMVVNNCTGSLGVNDPGSGTGYVYKNTFENVNVSLQAELDNRSDPSIYPGAGLEFKCNEFDNRISNDVTIVGKQNSQWNYSLGSIRDQGICSFDTKTPAGNQFYTSGCANNEQIETTIGSSDLPLYSAHSSSITYPICYNGVSVVYPACLTNFIQALSCPSSFNTCNTIPCLYSTYTNSQIKARQILDSYNQLIDGGNTSALLFNIYNIATPVGQLKNMLLSKSPYLSDTVLISYLHPPVATSPGTIKQVLLANSPLTKKVMNEVQNGSPGLPQGIVNQIEMAQTGVSARREKESEVDYYKFQANLSEVKLKQAYLAVDNLDSLKKIAVKDTTLQGLFKLMEVLIGKGDYSEAQTCLTKIIYKEAPSMSDHCKFNCIRLDLAQQGKTWIDMTSNQYNTIKQIYENNPETAIDARVVLAMTKGLKYERYPFDLISNSNHSPVIIHQTEPNQESDAALTNYPNPFTNETIIKAILPENERDGELVITDVMGKIVANYPLIKGINSIAVNNADLTNGIYFYYMIVNGVKIKTNKMVRTK